MEDKEEYDMEGDQYIVDDQLNRIFGLCMDVRQPMKIHFCVYNMNTSCYIEGNHNENDETLADILPVYNEFYPFLKFVMEKKDAYTFPSMEYTCPTIAVPSPSVGTIQNGGEPEDEKTPEQTHFENTCFTHVMGMFSDTSKIHQNKIDISTMYKGFIEKEDLSEDGEKILFVFFDMSLLFNYLKSDFITAGIDEILYKGKIYSTPVDNTISQLFKDNHFLQEIKNNKGSPYPFPMQLYMCKLVDGEYENVRKGADTWLSTIEHPFLSKAYFFSSDPVIESDTESLQRFICFIVRGLYIEKDISAANQEELDRDNNNSTHLTEEEKIKLSNDILYASTIYFHEKGLQMWAVKNIAHFTEI